MKRINHWLLMIILLLPLTGGAKEVVSIETLLKEMVDREEKARFPMPSFTCAQFSSYDRATVARDQPGWFATWDRSQFYGVDKRKGRTEYVMADAQGPGAIVRFWTTFAGPNCGKGILRIYIDDMITPVIEGKAFDIISGNLVSGYPLAASVSEATPYEQRGHNLYFPIPYSKRCKITYESEALSEDDPGALNGHEAVYYNINYRTYEQGTQVISYSAQQIEKNKALIDKTLSQLKEKDRGLSKVKLNKEGLSTELAPRSEQTFTITGTKAIRCLSMKIDAPEIEQALRSVVLEIAFDGERTVWAPVGDFFGTGPRKLYTNTWYTSVDNEGRMSSFWVMPFREKCEITLHNYGSQTIAITDAFAEYSSWKWDERSMYFGASWHQYDEIYTPGATPGVNEADAIDLNFVTLSGKGVYMGDGIALFNHSYTWWGEGDEKVYVDGETFPSHIGTGSEDYYGYAWCMPATFTDHPFIAQPCGNGSFAPAFTANTRLRSLDGIPFTKSIEFDMELWHWGRGYMDYAPTTFYYMLPGGTSNIEPDIVSVERKVALKRSDIMSDKITMAIEGENLVVDSVAGGNIYYQYDLPLPLSQGMQLFWFGLQKENKLFLTFRSDRTMDCALIADCLIASDYCTVDVVFNGRVIYKDLNLYNARLSMKKVNLGDVTVEKGENRLDVIVKEVPGTATNGGAFGIDRLEFVEK